MANPKKLYFIALLMAFWSGGFLFTADKEISAPPSLESAPFSLEGPSEVPAREPSSKAGNEDLLGDLEKLLDDPAQRDAQEQLGLPPVVEQNVLVEPLPKITLKKPEPKSKVLPMQKPQSGPEVLAKKPASVPKVPQSLAQKNQKKTWVSTQNEITGLDLYPTSAGHELVVRMTRSPKYQLFSNGKKKQFTYVFEKTVAPKKLKRAYETQEFNGPVARYSLGSSGKGKNLKTQLVLQMRDWTAPRLEVSGTNLKLEFLKPGREEKSRKVASELPENSTENDFLSGTYVFKGAPLEKLELKNTDVREAIRLVARSSGYNVVIGEDVKGNIGSLSLENIPWDQALFLILQSKKLGFVRHGNIVRVATLETLKTEKEELERQEDVEPIRTVLIPISYAKAATLAPRANPFLSKRGKVDTDDRSNTIIVRDINRVIERVQKLFSVLDTQPTAVSISAKFVEVKKSFLRTLGLGSISMGSQTSGVNLGFVGPTFGGTGQGGSINISAPRFAALNATLSIGESDSMVKVLANPTITVQQGQKGSILQGKTTEVPQAVAAAGATTTSLTQTANLSLDVTPIVANDGSISLETNLLQEIPIQVTNALAKDTRSLKTQIILQNGDTAVLGGVVASQENESNSGVPFLRNIPLLGLLFSQQKTSMEQNEVIIFITARILNPDSAFKQTL